MADSVDDIKQSRRAKAALLRRKAREAQDSIDELEEENREVYVNGESKELKEHCQVTKSKLKLKGTQ